jgi:hypothetical protein
VRRFASCDNSAMKNAVPFLVACALLVSPKRSLAVDYVADPLTGTSFPGRGSQGGTFTSEGWVTTSGTDSVWYEVPDAIPVGRVEYSVRGVSTTTTLTGADHDLLAIYQAPTGSSEPVPYSPDFRNNDMKVFTRIFGQVEGAPRTGAMKVEFVLCPRGEPWYHDEPCPSGCVGNLVGYANGAPNDIGWDGGRWYRMALWWGGGVMRFSRDGVELGGVDYAGEYAPGPVRVRIGSPRHGISADAFMPIGLTFKDVVVTGDPGNQSPLCEAAADAGTGGAAAADSEPPPDSSICDPAQPMSAAPLVPSSGQGAAHVFRTVYSHCQGASAFRVVQFLVADSVDPAVPSVGGGYEAGALFVGSGADTCLPGEPKVLSTPHGDLDCATSGVHVSGNDLIVDWSLRFAVAAFAGSHRFFVDAKGGSASPEPRLGWTDIGGWTVEPEPDGGSPPEAGSGWPDGSTGGGATPAAPFDGDSGNCACSFPRALRPVPAWPVLLALAAVARAARVRRRRGG